MKQSGATPRDKLKGRRACGNGAPRIRPCDSDPATMRHLRPRLSTTSTADQSMRRGCPSRRGLRPARRTSWRCRSTRRAGCRRDGSAARTSSSARLSARPATASPSTTSTAGPSTRGGCRLRTGSTCARSTSRGCPRARRASCRPAGPAVRKSWSASGTNHASTDAPIGIVMAAIGIYIVTFAHGPLSGELSCAPNPAATARRGTAARAGP